MAACDNPVAARCDRDQTRSVTDDYREPSERALRWVEAALGSNAQVLEVSRLFGGLTADMDRLTVAAGGDPFDVVLRRWSNSEWGTGLVDREAAGLEALVDHDLPVPRLLAVDRTGERTGVPSLLMTALRGAPSLKQSDVGDCLRAAGGCTGPHSQRRPHWARGDGSPRLRRAQGPWLDPRPRTRSGCERCRRGPGPPLPAGARAWRLPAAQHLVVGTTVVGRGRLDLCRQRSTGDRRRSLPALPGGGVLRRSRRGIPWPLRG